MRVQILQDIIDILRHKDTRQFKPIPCIKKLKHETILDVLFGQFETQTIQFEGANVKKLENVNAEAGVTEQTLTLLCQKFPKNRKDIKVLNIACGCKDQMNFLNVLGFKAYGTDIDITTETEFIKYADLNTQEALPFPDDFFDCVICQEIIEHIENPWLLFRKAKKVLKLDGTLIVTTPNIASICSHGTFNHSPIGEFAYFELHEHWQHINPLPYWEMLHIADYNGFCLEKLSGNVEYFFTLHPQKNHISAVEFRNMQIQQNRILHYQFAKKDREIKLYVPYSTHQNEVEREILKRDNKRIFTFWEPKDKMPGYIQLCLKTWKKFLPDYEIIICDYENLSCYLTKTELKQFLFKKFPLQQQSDALRAVLLKKYGGIWLDADTIITSNHFIKNIGTTPCAMIGIPEKHSPHLAFVYAPKGSVFIKAWADAIIPKVRFYRLMWKIKFLRTLFKRIWEKITCWDYLGNSILDPLASKVSNKDFMLIDREKIHALPEYLSLLSNKTAEENYRQFYFTKNKEMELAFKSNGIILLHNSWTPEKFKAMSQAEFLKQDIMIASLFKKILGE